MKIRPLHDRILVKREEEKERKKGGIIIPDTAKEKPQEGKVISVGNGRMLEDGKKVPLDVKTHDRILVKRLEEQETKRGGIIIPDTAKEKPQEGKVIAAGNGKVGEDGKRIPLDVKAGDKILFGKYSGSEVKIDEKEYLILREEDVLAILE